MGRVASGSIGNGIATALRDWTVAASLYFLAAAGMIHLTGAGTGIATIWPANAILIAMLLSKRRPTWGIVLSAGLVANVAANIVTRGSIAAPLLFSAANLLEIWLTTILLRRLHPEDSILRSPRTVGQFILFAGIVTPLASGIVGGLTANLLFGQPLFAAVATWALADGLGLLVFLPLFFAAFQGDFATCFASRSGLQRAEGAALLGGTAAIAYLVFFISEHPLLFAIFPPLMLVTFRIGRLGIKVAVAIVALIGGAATLQGVGPVSLMASDAAAQAFAFQGFLAMLLLTCLPVAAAITARNRLASELAAHGRAMMTMALTDPLTGLLNRAGFERAAIEQLARRGSKPLSLVALDVDHFKQINDRWGHQAGDSALIRVAAALRTHLRAHDRVGRVGGDEFLILLSGSDLDHAMLVAERIRRAIAVSARHSDGADIPVTSLSIGVASAAADDSYDTLVRRADRALYAAKAAGRDAVRHAA